MDEIAKDVVVDFEVVEFRAVKFWNVEEAVVRRFANVPKPVDVRFPPLAPVKKKFVEEAVVEKKLVEVAEVVVLLVMLSKMFAPVYVPLKPKLKPMAPEPELYVIGSVPERDEEDILLLNIDQSVDDSLPLAVAEEKGRLNVWVSPDAVIVKSVPVVDVERVWVEPV